jgi:sulfite reductase (NADPH) flavoprotein alpha-component
VEKREHAFLAKIKERYCLNPGSDKKTYHLIIDLEGSEISYAVGDCLGIFPQNDPSAVNALLDLVAVTGDTEIKDRHGAQHRLQEFFTSYANLSRIPQGPLSVADFCKKLSPLLPRFYSIASSQKVVGQEAHLTVGLVDGVCSPFLCERAPLNEPILPVFHQTSRHFSLSPESFHKPIMMIGPGTGIAPFRGFIQERISQKTSHKNWLFFGERTRRHDFYYQRDWEPLISAGQLDLDCAFSRDQEEKIYVQHRMLEKSGEIWKWLSEGAYLFVCGDASHMAKDVDKALHMIVEREGQYSPLEAKAYIKNLKHENRYQRDVY